MKTAHHRFAVAILALLVLPVPACSSRQSGQIEEAKVPAEVEVAEEVKAKPAPPPKKKATELEIARKVYADTVAEAKAELLNAFDRAIKKVAATGDLDGVKALQADKETASRGINLPESHSMRKHQVSFNEKILFANKMLAMALDSAVKKYTMDLQISMATAVQVEFKKLLKIIKADQAIKDCSEAIKLKPDDANAWIDRGATYLAKGDYDQAIKDCSEAIKLKPDDALAWYNRGVAYHEKGNYDQAIKDYSEAIKLKPDDVEAWNNRGDAYRHKDNYDQAIKDLSEAIKLKPDYASAWSNRGAAYADKGNYDQAIKDYSEAIKLNPGYVKAWYNRCLAYQRLGNFSASAADFKKAKELGYKP